MIDILIKNGTVIDGTGGPARTLDVAIISGKIAAMAENIREPAAQTIEARGRFVTPGFIDIQNHSDSYWTLFDQPEQASMLSQGITTIIVGNCGASLAPLLSPQAIKSIQKWHNLAGLNINWTSMTEFFEALGKLPLGVNVGTLVGHATVRRGLLGDEVRSLTEEELDVMDQAIKESLGAGALGLSMGLVYAHEVNSSLAELTRLIKNLQPSQKYLSVHLRSEASHVLESLDEVIGLARQSGVAVKISHLKIRGEKNWPLFEQMLSKLETAYHQGVKISFDAYPYETTWSVLYTYLPKWAYEGGRDSILSLISEPMNRRKILDYLRNQNHDFGSIIVATAPGNSNFVGKTIRQIAANQNITSEEAVLNVLTATGAQVIVFDENLSRPQVERLLASPLGLVATDGAGYSHRVENLVHPRCFGAMPRFLRLMREQKLLKWEAAIKKITSEPAQLLGLIDRGRLAAGQAADVVVFDPETIADRADYAAPDRLSEGIELVIVNGKLAFTPKQYWNASGIVVKR